MLEANGVVARYNVVKRRTELVVPWLYGTTENADAVSLTHILSLASRYGMPTGLVPAAIEALADENSYSPVADWIASRKWDGTDRLQSMCDTLTPRDGYPLELRDVLVRKWLLSAVAAATLTAGFRTRGVLTLQGRQGLGKTSWGLSLIDDDRLRESVMKVDLHIDPSNKDSLIVAVEHWICELGEIESSFKRDVSRLKGFLTAGSDKLRRPYARVAAEYQRRTVFYASVNASDFLVDETGNTRFWTIPCVAIDWRHGIDVQQVFAQCSELLKNGAEWWLTSEEEAMLERENDRHRSFSLVRERLAEVVDLTVADTSGCRQFTPSELLEAAGFERPTNSQAKECASYLRQWFGESRRIQGINKWRVPLRAGARVEGGEDEREMPEPQPRSKFD